MVRVKQSLLRQSELLNEGGVNGLIRIAIQSMRDSRSDPNNRLNHRRTASSALYSAAFLFEQVEEKAISLHMSEIPFLKKGRISADTFCKRSIQTMDIINEAKEARRRLESLARRIEQGNGITKSSLNIKQNVKDEKVRKRSALSWLRRS